jgi:putative hydrolase of the HAD superfamily
MPRKAMRPQTFEGLEAVLFDLGGTLDGPGIPWKDRFYRLFDAAGVGVSPEQFASAFYRVDDGLVGAVPRGLSLRDTVDRLACGLDAALALDAPALAKHVGQQFYDEAMRSAQASAGTLGRLAGRYRLGVVSNFYGNLDAVCDELGLLPYLSVMVDSTAVGFTKPDARIFRHALDHLGVQPAAAAFVGDSAPRDMAGARGVGMVHVWLTGDHGHVTVEPCCPGDPVIRTLDMLPGLLL